MIDPTTRELLARLEAQDARVLALESEVRRYRRRRSRPQRLLPLALVALLVAFVPLSTLAVTTFNDLTGGAHDANINAIYQAGVTTGCVPNQEYCPAAQVTREEMASFLARLGGLGGNPPVANAAALNGYAANALLRVAHGQRQDDYNVTAAYTTHASLVITAPAPGFVLVTGSAEFIFDTGPCPCVGGARLRHAEASAESYTSAAVVTTTIDRARVPLIWTFQVGTGVQHLELRVIKQGGTGSLKVVSGNLTALFVPFGPTGGSTLDAP